MASISDPKTIILTSLNSPFVARRLTTSNTHRPILVDRLFFTYFPINLKFLYILVATNTDKIYYSYQRVSHYLNTSFNKHERISHEISND
ncbi:hypothetical protein PSMA108079_05650 [Pseudoalteromonas mariniglutinosa]